MILRSRIILRYAAAMVSLLFLLISASLPAMAVTEKEMEEARTAAAILYLRWADNGSGYLDELKPAPKTIAELEKKLKKKELENLAPFKAIPFPADYGGWSKEKFVEYWSSTVFNSPKLSADGKRAKDRVRKKVAAMSVSAPVKTEAPAQPEKEAATAEKPASETETSNPPMPDFNDMPEVAAAADSIMEAQEQLVEAREELNKKKETSYTWIYIVVLCVLVAIVIWLVIFASRVMKNDSASKGRVSEDSDSLERNVRTLEAAGAEQTAVNNRMAALLEKKNEEIASLRRHNDSLTSEAASLRTKLMDTQAQLETVKRNLEETRAEVRAANAAAKSVERAAEPQPASRPSPAPARVAETNSPNHTGEQPASTTIYLGRANNKGIFVRADRHLTPGKTFFRLDTSDGYAGTFRVANNPLIWELALLTPHESLEGACVAKNFDDTEGKTTVVNEAAGTAIFENGCWKVIRKAKIRFE